MTPRTILTALSALSLSSLAPAVFAHEVGSRFQQHLVDSDLVFEGRVVGVDYEFSTPDASGRGGLVHTFVTFQVERLYKGSVAPPTRSEGSAEPDTLTLRFLGGPEGDDTYLMAWGVPLFDPGDVDVLMVRGNGRLACPLVDCEHGRYRIIDRLVYNDFGHEIVSTDQAAVLYGRFHELPEVLINHVGPVEIGRDGEIEIDETGTPRVLPDFGTHYDAEGFRAVLADTLRDLAAAGLLPPTEPVESQDLRAAFRVDPAPPVADLPRVEAEATPPVAGALRADRLEEIFTRNADDDPVLDPKRAAFLSWFLENELRRLGRKEAMELQPAARPGEETGRRRK
jgi:hypothetical protein